MIMIDDLHFSFDSNEALTGIQLNIEPGSFTVILGRNGSGKSTLAKHLNAILIPKTGTVTIDNMDTADENVIYDIRECVGMVFQNPESQAIASIVEDDVAFGPENLGLCSEEITERVNHALEACRITDMRYKPISTLSGGQKQLAAIAGIVAMRPGYMVVDEGTSMLDPSSRKHVLDCVKELRNELGIAIIWITHYMDEAVSADRVIITDKGRIIKDGTPKDIFSDYALISRSGLELPECTKLALMLRNEGYNVPVLPLTPAECAGLLINIIQGKEKGI